MTPDADPDDPSVDQFFALLYRELKRLGDDDVLLG